MQEKLNIAILTSNSTYLTYRPHTACNKQGIPIQLINDSNKYKIYPILIEDSDVVKDKQSKNYFDVNYLFYLNELPVFAISHTVHDENNNNAYYNQFYINELLESDQLKGYKIEENRDKCNFDMSDIYLIHSDENKEIFHMSKIIGYEENKIYSNKIYKSKISEDEESQINH